VVTTSPPTEASNVELVRWVFDVLNSHQSRPLLPYWTTETIERFPQATCVGGEAIARYFEDLFTAVPDLHFRVDTVSGQGEDVFVHWHLTGRHTGAPSQGVDATGRAIALDGMDHFVVRDGIIVSNFVVFDQMQFARQLGLLPADGSLPDRALRTAFNAKTKLLRLLRRA